MTVMIAFLALIILSSAVCCLAPCYAQNPRTAVFPVASATEIPSAQLIQPEELLTILRSDAGPKPLLLQVGFHVLYAQAHIPNSEYIAPASSPHGVRQLRSRVEKLPRTHAIILYCGCCPWNHCPNVQPAYQELQQMGFKNVKILYIARDFGSDWVAKGYPVESGQ